MLMLLLDYSDSKHFSFLQIQPPFIANRPLYYRVHCSILHGYGQHFNHNMYLSSSPTPNQGLRPPLYCINAGVKNISFVFWRFDLTLWYVEMIEVVITYVFSHFFFFLAADQCGGGRSDCDLRSPVHQLHLDQNMLEILLSDVCDLCDTVRWCGLDCSSAHWNANPVVELSWAAAAAAVKALLSLYLSLSPSLPLSYHLRKCWSSNLGPRPRAVLH